MIRWRPAGFTAPIKNERIVIIMCGRYYFSGMTNDEKLNAIMNMMDRKYPGAYKTGEIFPGDTAPAVIQQNGKLLPVPAVFGFPGFDGKRLLINARSETVAQKKTFADSLETRRAILPALGFYEWSHEGKKTKYFFQTKNQPVLYLCGVYKVIDGQVRFVILTRPANESMIEIHDRMPVIAKENEVRPYLTDHDAAMEIIAFNAPVLTRELANAKKS